MRVHIDHRAHRDAKASGPNVLLGRGDAPANVWAGTYSRQVQAHRSARTEAARPKDKIESELYIGPHSNEEPAGGGGRGGWRCGCGERTGGEDGGGGTEGEAGRLWADVCYLFFLGGGIVSGRGRALRTGPGWAVRGGRRPRVASEKKRGGGGSAARRIGNAGDHASWRAKASSRRSLRVSTSG